MTLDELEAIKLADLEGLYQEQAAARMNVSRSTFGRIVTAARRKVAEALVAGKVLRIEGGTISTDPLPRPRCQKCHLEWEQGAPSIHPCPGCQCPKRVEKLARAQADSTETRDAVRNPCSEASAKETTQ